MDCFTKEQVRRVRPISFLGLYSGENTRVSAEHYKKRRQQLDKIGVVRKNHTVDPEFGPELLGVAQFWAQLCEPFLCDTSATYV
jgi:hypothetical protein